MNIPEHVWRKLSGKLSLATSALVLRISGSRAEREAASESLFSSFGGVLVQNSSICNARCIFCPYPQLKEKGKIMTDEIFERTVEEFIAMGGGHFGFLPVIGEPCMDPKLLLRIKRVRELDCTKHISITTNGILLDRFGIPEILRSGLNSISISTSGFDEDMYKRIYGSDQYQRMLSNVIALLEENNRVGDPVYVEIEIRADQPMNKIVQKKDFQRIRRLTDKIHFLNRFDNWGGIITTDHLSGAMKMRGSRNLRRSPCKMVLWSPMIFANGDIGACTCRDPQGDGAFRLGNISRDHLADIWRGFRRRALFKCFQEGRYPKICRRCSRYVGWDSTVLKIMRNSKKSMQGQTSHRADV
jgi:MoaA/NifB/PqqE/SkfB family radical SAM enzyme